MEEEDFSKLPVDERCALKSWKARVSGYEEAVKLFNQWDGDDPNWKKVNIQIRTLLIFLFVKTENVIGKSTHKMIKLHFCFVIALNQF